jgi:hypothetical protein
MNKRKVQANSLIILLFRGIKSNEGTFIPQLFMGSFPER